MWRGSAQVLAGCVIGTLRFSFCVGCAFVFMFLCFLFVVVLFCTFTLSSASVASVPGDAVTLAPNIFCVVSMF